MHKTELCITARPLSILAQQIHDSRSRHDYCSTRTWCLWAARVIYQYIRRVSWHRDVTRVSQQATAVKLVFCSICGYSELSSTTVAAGVNEELVHISLTRPQGRWGENRGGWAGGGNVTVKTQNSHFAVWAEAECAKRRGNKKKREWRKRKKASV